MLIQKHASATLHTVRAAIRRNGEAGRPVERLFVRMNRVGATHEIVGMLDDRTDEARVHKGPVDVSEATGSRSFGLPSTSAQERLRHGFASSQTGSDSVTLEGHGRCTWTARRGLTRRNLARACSYIENNLGTNFTLDELARAVGISRFHFSRLFRESTGESPMGYSLRLRIERAGHALAERSEDFRDSRNARLLRPEPFFAHVSSHYRRFSRGVHAHVRCGGRRRVP